MIHVFCGASGTALMTLLTSPACIYTNIGRATLDAGGILSVQFQWRPARSTDVWLTGASSAVRGATCAEPVLPNVNRYTSWTPLVAFTPEEVWPVRGLIARSATINLAFASFAWRFTQSTECLSIELEAVDRAAADASCAKKVSATVASCACVRGARAAFACTVALDAAKVGFVISKRTKL